MLRQNCKKHRRLVTLMTVCVCFSVGFTVMGFKPRSKIKDDHYVSPASFIYPSEKVGGALLPWLHSPSPPPPPPRCQDVTGSTQLFSALLERCLAREVVAICSYIRTDGAAPIFIALIPQVCVCVCVCVYILCMQPFSQ